MLSDSISKDSLMLSVTIKSIVLSVAMLSITNLCFVILVVISADCRYMQTIINGECSIKRIKLSVIMLSVIMLSVVASF
jgi:hypothetical protein